MVYAWYGNCSSYHRNGNSADRATHEGRFRECTEIFARRQRRPVKVISTLLQVRELRLPAAGSNKRRQVSRDHV